MMNWPFLRSSVGNTVWNSGYTTQTPCLENVELAKGYDVVDIITTIMDKPMIDAFHAAGIRCISSRTIGYDHIDTEYAIRLAWV